MRYICFYLTNLLFIQEDLVTSAEKTYEIEYFDNKFVVKKIVSHEKSSYLPWLHRSFGTQYIETKYAVKSPLIVSIDFYFVYL